MDSYQAEDAILTLQVDCDVGLDEVTGQHGDPDAQVG